VKPLRRAMALILGGGVSLSAPIHLPGTLGCQTHDCDPVFICIDSNGLMKPVSQALDCTPTTQGETPIPGYTTNVVSIPEDDGRTELIWATSSINGPWLDYRGNYTYIINYPRGLLGNTPSAYFDWISADNPVEAGASHSNSISGGDYIAEVLDVGPDQITFNNATCAHYSLRIEVQAQVTQGIADAGAVE
jgi:hypothetical protein